MKTGLRKPVLYPFSFYKIFGFVFLVMTSMVIKGQKLPYSKGSEIQSQVTEYGPETKPKVNIPQSDALFDLQFDVPVGVGGGEAGIESDGTYIYTSMWNGTGEFQKYDASGTWIKTFTIAAATACRDIAYNGTYFYGAAASTTVFEMNFSTETMVSTFTAPTDVRAIAYNENDDSFYANNWGSDIINFDMTGANLGYFSAGPIGDSYYGFAYQSAALDGNGPFLWGYAQVGATSNELIQISLPGGTETGVYLDIATVASVGTGSAGGLAITDGLVSGYHTILGTSQNENIWGLELCAIPNDDLGVQTIVSPNTGTNLTVSETVTVTVKNYGINVQTNFDLSYTVDGGSAVTESASVTLNYGDTYQHTFSTSADLSAYGIYDIEACVSITGGDDLPANDCLTKSVINLSPTLCTPVYTTGCFWGDGFTDFELEEIVNNGSGCADLNGTGWSQYLGLGPANLIAGGTYTITMATGWDNNFASVWVDWNDDLLLEASEMVIDNFEMVNAGIFYDVDFDVPPGATTGQHLMRARTNWTGTCDDPCTSYNYGEAEDYMINVQPSASITTGTISPTTINAGSTVGVPYTIIGTFFSGNVFTAQLSDASSIFTSPVVIGTLTSTTAGTITATIPAETCYGSAYRIRVVSSLPPETGSDNGNDLTIVADLEWSGAISTDWNETGNWTCGAVPISTNNVQIPNVSNKPVLSIGSMGRVNNITIDNGSSLTVTGNTIQVAGTITNNGIFTASEGTVEMNGTTVQSIGAGIFEGNTIMGLIVSNTSGVILSGPLNVSESVALNGNLTSNGNLTLLSTGDKTAYIDGSGTASVTGNVTMHRHLPSAFGYKYFSSPFQLATVNEFNDDMDLSATFPTFYRYDESQTSSGWVDYTNPTGSLNPIHGYAVNFGSGFAAATADISGVVNNGNVQRTMYNNNNDYTQGFNLVGNPYPSPMDWDAASGWTKTNIDNALYFFRAGGYDQYSGTYHTYINGISSDGVASNIIPSMQGFFIHVSDGSFPVTGTLGMTNSVRTTSDSQEFIKSGTKGPDSYFRLTTQFKDKPDSPDAMVIYFEENASTKFDREFDAIKLLNTDYNTPNFYSIASDGFHLSINALPSGKDSILTIPVGIKTKLNGNITFKIKDIENSLFETKVYLYDETTKTNLSLDSDNGRTIYLKAGEYNNRFFIKLAKGNIIIPEDMNPDLLSATQFNGKVKVETQLLPGSKGIIYISNIAGQTVFIKEIYDSGAYEFNPQLKNGIYIVTLLSENVIKSKKIFLLNK